MGPDIPIEIWIKICSYLCRADLCSAQLVSKVVGRAATALLPQPCTHYVISNKCCEKIQVEGITTFLHLPRLETITSLDMSDVDNLLWLKNDDCRELFECIANDGFIQLTRICLKKQDLRSVPSNFFAAALTRMQEADISNSKISSYQMFHFFHKIITQRSVKLKYLNLANIKIPKALRMHLLPQVEHKLEDF